MSFNLFSNNTQTQQNYGQPSNMFNNNPSGGFNNSAAMFNNPNQYSNQGNSFSNPSSNMGNPIQMNPIQTTQQRNYVDQLKKVWSDVFVLAQDEVGRLLKAMNYYVSSSKKQMEEHMKEFDKNTNEKSNQDSNRYELVRKRCQEMKEKNEDIRKEVLRIQEDVLKIANTEGRVVRHPDSDAQLYRRVSESKRILAEICRKLYAIRAVPRHEMKEEKVELQPLNELEMGVQILTKDIAQKRIEWDALLKMLE